MNARSDSIIYFISGMWCGTCARSIKESVQNLNGVCAADVNYATKLLLVTPENEVSFEWVDEQVREHVRRIGFGIKRQTEGWVLRFDQELKQETEKRVTWLRVAIVFFLAMWSSMIAFSGYLGKLSESEQFYIAIASSAFGLPAILYGMIPFARAGIRALFLSHILTFDFIIFLGAVSVVLFSSYSLMTGAPVTYADSGSMILAVLLFAKRAELSIAERLTENLLFELNPHSTKYKVFRRNEWKYCEASKIRRNENIHVRAGEVIPVDGKLLSDGLINNHLMTGENSTVELHTGDEVSAGAIAVSSLQLQVTAPQGERLIDNWAEAALTAGMKSSTYSKAFAKMESALVFIALCGSAGAGIVSYLRGGSVQNVAEAAFVGVLVFCPCLFAAILPLAKQIAHLSLRRAGILLSRSDALLDLTRAQSIYFDKTGTLEAAESTYNPIRPVENVLDLLSEIATQCPHPILRGLKKTKTKVEAIHSIKEVAGEGVIARLYNGDEVVVGRKEFLQKNNVVATDAAAPYPLVAFNGEIVGEIVHKPLYDKNSLQLINSLLQKFPYGEVHVLSGDPDLKKGRRYTKLSERVRYTGNLKPEQKAQIVKRRESVFIGDGLNDILALAAAKVGVRVGHRIVGFAPVDVHLLANGLELIPRFFDYAHKYRRVLVQTGLAAFVYNLIAVSLAVTGHFSPLGAVLAMMGSFTLMLLSIWRLNHFPGGER